MTTRPKIAGGAGIYAPAGLAAAIRQQATFNAEEYKFFASRGRTDISCVSNFRFTKRHPDQFPKTKEMLALILNEIDHSRILARLIRGLAVPKNAVEWKSMVASNKIKESRFMLSILTITKSRKENKEGEDESRLTVTDHNAMDNDAVKMLMSNCSELLFSVILTTAHSMIEPELAGVVRMFDRNKVSEDKLSTLHAQGCIVGLALKKLEKHLKVSSPRVHSFLTSIETNRDVANGQPHLWKRKNQPMYVYAELLLKHFAQCKSCGAERNAEAQTNVLVSHLEWKQREFLTKEVYTEEDDIHSFTFAQTVEKLMSLESRQNELAEWNDERPSEHAAAQTRQRQHANFTNDGRVSRNNMALQAPRQQQDRSNERRAPRSTNNQRNPSAQNGPSSSSRPRKTTQELLQEAKRLVKSPDHFHVFKFMVSCQQKNPEARDFFNKWVWKLLTSFARFKRQGCDTCNSSLVPHILCPGCHPALRGLPSDSVIIEHLKSRGHNRGGTKRRSPTDRNSNNQQRRGQRPRAHHTVSFEPTNISFYSTNIQSAESRSRTVESPSQEGPTESSENDSTMLTECEMKVWTRIQRKTTERSKEASPPNSLHSTSVLLKSKASGVVSNVSEHKHFSKLQQSFAKPHFLSLQPNKKWLHEHYPKHCPGFAPGHPSFMIFRSSHSSVSMLPSRMSRNQPPAPDLRPLKILRDASNKLKINSQQVNSPLCAHHPHCDTTPTEIGSTLCEECTPIDSPDALPCSGCLTFDPDFSVKQHQAFDILFLSKLPTQIQVKILQMSINVAHVKNLTLTEARYPNPADNWCPGSLVLAALMSKHLHSLGPGSHLCQSVSIFETAMGWHTPWRDTHKPCRKASPWKMRKTVRNWKDAGTFTNWKLVKTKLPAQETKRWSAHLFHRVLLRLLVLRDDCLAVALRGSITSQDVTLTLSLRRERFPRLEPQPIDCPLDIWHTHGTKRESNLRINMQLFNAAASLNDVQRHVLTLRQLDSTCQVQHYEAHTADANSHDTKHCALLSQSSKTHITWILDSGASGMFTNDPSILFRKRPIDAKVSGSNKDSSPMRATHIGRYGIFPNVLLVPSIAQNLMSVSILRKLGFHVDFNNLRVSRGAITWDFEHNKEKDLFFLQLPREPIKAFTAHNAVTFTSWNLAEVYHRRFNHVSRRALQRITKDYNLKVPRKHFQRMRLCSGCALSKATNHPVPSKLPRRPDGLKKIAQKPPSDPAMRKPFSHISIDTCGPIVPRSYHGSNYFHVFVCKTTSYIHVACTKLKSDVAQEFIDFHRVVVQNRGFKTKVVRTDGALELTRSRLQNFLLRQGIRTEVTPPYSSFANAHAERSIRTVTEGVRTLLTDSGVATHFWSYAAAAFEHVYNRLPRIRKRAPLHIITNVKPKIGHIRIFGCRCHVYTHPQERLKSHRFKPTARVGTFLGYVPGSKSFFVKIESAIYRRRSVNFNEDIDAMILKLKSRHHPHSQPTPMSALMPVEGVHPNQSPSEPHSFQAPKPNNPQTVESKHSKDFTGHAGDSHESSFGHAGDTDTIAPSHQLPSTQDQLVSFPDQQEPVVPTVSNKPAPVESKAPLRRSSRNNRGVPPFKLGIHNEAHLVAKATEGTTDLDFISPTNIWQHSSFWASACEQHAFTVAKALDFTTPRTFKEAVNGPQSEEWSKSIERELKSLREKGVWKVTKATSQRPIGMKWVFKVKQDENGNVTKFKSRLVCQGFRQRHGIDFFDTYAPVANYASIRVLLALAARDDLEIHQMDVDVAFLNGILKETVYCKPPPGVNVPSGHVLLLVRALYGTKQAARVWWQNIDDTFMTKLHLKKSSADPCVYFRPFTNTNLKRLFLVLFVDDILIFSNCLETIKQTKQTLKNTYSMTDQGELRWCLGMRVLRDRAKRVITLDQQRYILDVLERFGMSKCNPVSTPMLHDNKLSAKDCPETPEELKELRSYHQLFRSMVGSVSYAALSTRPDIATATIVCAKFSHNPGKVHLIAAKRILRYLAGTSDYCLMFGGYSFMSSTEEVLLPLHDPRSPANMLVDLMAFSDSDWAGDVDKRRSTSGYIFFIFGGPVSWKSKMQKCVAQSSAEAEYIAASETSKEVTWLRSLISTYNGRKLEKPTVILVDNQAAISIVKNPVCSSKTKHIELRYHLVRDYYERGIILVEHVPTQSNHADMLTKPTPRIIHHRLRDHSMSSQPIKE